MMTDPAIHEANRASTARIHALGDLSDEALRTPVGEHWTVSVALAHLAFWDLRALDVLERTERTGSVDAPGVDPVVNDLALGSWSAIPPRDALRLAIEAADAMDARVAGYPADLVAAVEAVNERWIRRSLHRDPHLDEVERALGRSAPGRQAPGRQAPGRQALGAVPRPCRVATASCHGSPGR